MSHLTAAVRDGLVQHLTPSGRDRARRIRRAEVDALLAADRVHIVRLLAAIGEYQLGLAEISRRRTVAVQPQVARCAQAVIDGLAAAIVVEIERFAYRESEAGEVA